MHVVGQDHPGIDGEGAFGAGLADGAAKGFNLAGQGIGAAPGRQVDRIGMEVRAKADTSVKADGVAGYGGDHLSERRVCKPAFGCCRQHAPSKYRMRSEPNQRHFRPH